MQAALMLEALPAPVLRNSSSACPQRVLGRRGSTTAAVFPSWLCSTFPWKGSWNSGLCSSSHAVPLLTSLRTRRRRITLSCM